MDKIIKLNSRGGNVNILSQLKPVKEGVESKTYLLKTEENIWTGYNDNNKFYVNPAGGPMLEPGAIINDFKIKFVDCVAGVGFVITFE